MFTVGLCWWVCLMCWICVFGILLCKGWGDGWGGYGWGVGVESSCRCSWFGVFEAGLRLVFVICTRSTRHLRCLLCDCMFILRCSLDSLFYLQNRLLESQHAQKLFSFYLTHFYNIHLGIWIIFWVKIIDTLILDLDLFFFPVNQHHLLIYDWIG